MLEIGSGGWPIDAPCASCAGSSCARSTAHLIEPGEAFGAAPCFAPSPRRAARNQMRGILAEGSDRHWGPRRRIGGRRSGAGAAGRPSRGRRGIQIRDVRGARGYSCLSF